MNGAYLGFCELLADTDHRPAITAAARRAAQRDDGALWHQGGVGQMTCLAPRWLRGQPRSGKECAGQTPPRFLYHGGIKT